MTTHRALTSTRPLLNKVPEITLYFWVIKVLCTTVGESAADYLNVNLGLGLSGTSLITGVLLVGALIFQFAADGYVPGRYWLAVAQATHGVPPLYRATRRPTSPPSRLPCPARATRRRAPRSVTSPRSE